MPDLSLMFDLGVSEESTIYGFAMSYREACLKVRSTWRAVIETETNTPERKAAVTAYTKAQRHAREMREALLAAAADGLSEYGQ